MLSRKIISDTWQMLNQSIYTGPRLSENLKALTFAGVLFAAVGLVLTAFDLYSHKGILALAGFLTFLFGAACAYCAHVLKRRALAIIMPTLFCMVAFTVYTLSGAGSGNLILWTFTLPIGICYFVSVKWGICLSAYYALLFILVFYTPLGKSVQALYTPGIVQRFPLIFISTAALTISAMIQYHRGILLEADYAQRLAREVERQTHVANQRADQLETMSREMVQTLALTIDVKDPYTNGHSFRVSRYAVALANALGWPQEEIQDLAREALLHDVGKIGIPDSILNKPGKLTREEFKVIQSHTVTGGEILSRSQSLLDASQVARYHHERYDGSGYPEGLSGEDIPRHARAVAIADVFDAMRSDRIYRKGLPLDVIRSELVKGRGTQFDPQMLTAFLALLDAGALDEIAEL